MENEKVQNVLDRIATSKWIDLIGVAIVIATSVAAGYLTETLNDVTHWGGWPILVPFGLISIFNTVLSIMSTRLTSRMSNVGNLVGIVNAVLSGVIDYLLGNRAAIITYPITFLIYVVAIRHWMKSDKYKASKPLTGKKAKTVMSAIFAGTMIFSFATNYIGFQQFNLLFWLTTIIFGLSLGANILNAMKLTVQWQYWLVYDGFQLVKSFIQGNFANFGKYIYYIITAVAGLSFWKRRTPQTDEK